VQGHQVKGIEESHIVVYRRATGLLLVCIASFAWFPQNDYWSAHWFNRWTLTLIVVSAAIGWRFARIHWCLVAPVSIGLLTALAPLVGLPIHFAWRGLNFSPFVRPEDTEAVQQAYATAFALLAFAAYAATAAFEELEGLADGIGLFCLVNSAFMVTQFWIGRGPLNRGAMIGNPSMAGCLVATTWPILVRSMSKLRLWFGFQAIVGLFVFGAVFCAHASQPVMVMCAVYISKIFLTRRSAQNRMINASLCMAAFLCIGMRIKGVDFFENDGRFRTMYLPAFDHWFSGNGWVHLFGFGNGTEGYLLPRWINELPSHRTASPGTTFDYFFWQHSDWLQQLIEQGVIGLIALVTMFVCALQQSAKKAPWLFCAVAGYGTMAVFNFPAHLPAHALVGVTLLAMTFRKDFAC
jgi:hypothetical protein